MTDNLLTGAEEVRPDDIAVSEPVAVAPAASDNEPERELSLREQLEAASKEVSERARDEAGRFKKAEESTAEESKPKPTEKAQEPVKAEEAKPVAPAAHKPPVGWTAEAKAAFDALPDAVKESIAKREDEVNKGFQILQNYKGLEEYAPLVQQANTTFKDVVQRAVNWEQALITNPVAALQHISKLTGIPIQIGQGNGQPAQMASANVQQQAVIDPDTAAMIARQEFQKMQTAQTIEQFFASHPEADGLVAEMEAIMNLARSKGQQISLADAFEQAKWTNPDFRQTLINQRLAEAQPKQPDPALNAEAIKNAKAASRSVTGRSPAGPSSIPNGPAPTLREELQRAISAHRV